jgi:hypothetical protein
MVMSRGAQSKAIHAVSLGQIGDCDVHLQQSSRNCSLERKDTTLIPDAKQTGINGILWLQSISL